MYSTCIHCNRSLGGNELVEVFPVGRRLAFDAERGRLWAVCPHCGRWNLSPLEERWEAIEACERLYRDTPRRASTDNMGLAQTREGLELVRVGRPLRPEFAAWRYGTELLKRRGRDLAGGVAAVGSGIGMVAGTAAGVFTLGLGAFVVPLVYAGGVIAWVRRQDARVVGRADDASDTGLIRVRHLKTVRFVPGQGDGPVALRVESDAGPVELRAQPAARIASVACAERNQIGGSRRWVQEAVRRVEDLAGPEAVLSHAAGAGELVRMRYVDRLALEIALHEETERRAMEGELLALEEAWREAEAIAAIADTLLLPASVHDFIDRVRGPRRAMETAEDASSPVPAPPVDRP